MLVVNTGVLFAVADSADRHHDVSDELLAAHAGQLAVPTPVIVQASWLIETRLGPAAEVAFVRSVAGGELTAVNLIDVDWNPVAELVDRYADLGLRLVDATVVGVAERLDITSIATLNHRDFAVVRPAHCAAFTLVP